MSRIGSKPIVVPSGVEVKINAPAIEVKGPKGTLSRSLHPSMKIELVDGQVTVARPSDSKQDRSLHGLTRTLIYNMVVGVTKGFAKKLLIEGVGYKAELKGKNLLFSLGYSHTIDCEPPEGIEFVVDDRKTTINVKGINKELVGQMAAIIRGYRKPDPYKGKGIRYSDEVVKKKPGKAASAGAGAGGG